MKKQVVLFAVLLTLLCISACLKDRNFPVPPAGIGAGGRNNIQPATIVINEFMAKGTSSYGNELNSPEGSDFIELYNTTGDTIELLPGKWFLTDSLGHPIKFQLPEAVIPPHGFLLIYTDGTADPLIAHIHADFKLSSNGEQIGLYYMQDSTAKFYVDQTSFGPQQTDISYGRIPDGSGNWSFMTQPTPGERNK